jgi:hypothetical protein
MKTLTALLIFGLLSCRQSTTTGNAKAIDNSSQIVLVSAGSSNGISQKGDNDSSKIYDKYIDRGLRAYMDTAFTDWTLPPTNRWDTVYFNLYQGDSSLVNYVSGDFDCNGMKDFVLVLQKRTGVLGVYAFLSTGSSFKPAEIMDLGKDTGEQIAIGLDLLPPGNYQYLEPGSEVEAPPIKIRCNGIRVLHFENTAETFYWEKGKFKSIPTGD